MNVLSEMKYPLNGPKCWSQKAGGKYKQRRLIYHDFISIRPSRSCIFTVTFSLHLKGHFIAFLVSIIQKAAELYNDIMCI